MTGNSVRTVPTKKAVIFASSPTRANIRKVPGLKQQRKRQAHRGRPALDGEWSAGEHGTHEHRRPLTASNETHDEEHEELEQTELLPIGGRDAFKGGRATSTGC